MRRLGRLIGKTVWAVALACVATLLLAIVVVSVGSLTGQMRLTTMLTGSMEPDLPVGSAIVLRPMNTLDVEVGDVIAFNPPDNPNITVIHRIISIEGYDPAPVVITKGDANEDVDPYTPMALRTTQTWVPTVVAPRIGEALLWFQTGAFVRVTLFLVAFGWLAVMWSIWRPRKPAELPGNGHQQDGENVAEESSGVTVGEDLVGVVQAAGGTDMLGDVDGVDGSKVLGVTGREASASS